jgi:hypothetical protein
VHFTADNRVNVDTYRPYANPQMVSLNIGPDATRFTVHDSILRQSEVLAAKSDPWGPAKQFVLLPELDIATAHSLVHYLYTGKYQTLDTQASSDKVILEGYKLSTCVYCVAVRYKLPGLAELAMEKIASFDDDVSIFDVLAVARDYAFPLLPEEDAWYPTYVESALNTAMAEDPEPFRKPDFITQVEGNSKLLQVVWKTVMSNYARAPGTPVTKDDEAITPTPEVVSDASGSADVEAPEEAAVFREADEEPEVVSNPAPLPAAVNDVADAPTEDIATADSETTQESPSELEDIEPAAETPVTPKPFTDELGFGMSKTYQQMGRKLDHVAINDRSSAESKIPTHIRSDSVMQEDQSVEKDRLEAATSVGADQAGDVEHLLNEASDAAMPPKKSKKKKKKSSNVFH